MCPIVYPARAAAGRHPRHRQSMEAVPDATGGGETLDCQHSRHHRGRRLFGFVGGQYEPRAVQGGTPCLSSCLFGV